MISIIIPFCDKDVAFLATMLQHLKCMGSYYEVLFVDDRKDKSVRADTGNYPCLTYEGNKGTFYARRYGFEHSRGDYIWFIDVDDRPYPFSIKGETADVLVFPYEVDNNGKLRVMAEPAEEYVADTMDSMKLASERHLNGSMWNKVFKRSLLEQAYGKLPWYEGLHVFEDCFLQAWMCSCHPSIKFIRKKIYRYTEARIYWFCEHPKETAFFLDHIPQELHKIWSDIVDDRDSYHE